MELDDKNIDNEEFDNQEDTNFSDDNLEQDQNKQLPDIEFNPMELGQNSKYISGMYQNWFLEYASYVILERAVPHLFDGLKPVQRRILHSMKRLDDGRYNKVANIIGHTMQFHPHGDASIGDALVQLGQKDLLIDTQGNWGNILTGDRAAAPRYIEARLSKFAIDVVFNPKTTAWKDSYDGRNKEPVTLPVKFPLLLAQGVDGIAVGLASKILPHNFNELIDACIAHLQGKDFEILPDFPTGGLADVSRYNNGLRGGKVKVRAKINIIDKKILSISEIPFSVTTQSLIDSIIQANDKGKIKIKKIDDNTAAEVEILIHLLPNTSPDVTIDALYAFTDCEVSISPNCCIIDNEKPKFLGVKEILKESANQTVSLLKQELLIKLSELEQDWHLSSLEKIFIENELYEPIKQCKTEEEILQTIDKGLEPFKPKLLKPVVNDDLVRLSNIPIKRISKFSSFKADQYIKGIEDEMEKTKEQLNNIIPYTIEYYKNIKKKYGKGRDRRTELRNFETIIATKVVAANEKLYVNREEGFIGTSLKKDEFVMDCSDIDDIIVFLRDGKYFITKVSPKSFVGKNILHCAVFDKNDERTIYNAVYLDGESGIYYMKRFAVKGVTRDKEYNVTQGTPNSKVIYFSANPNGEAEVIKVMLKPAPRLKKTVFEVDFSELAIKGRGSMGNILTKYSVHKIQMLQQGSSTLKGRSIWFDADVMRLNTDEKGQLLGEFSGNDKILAIYKSGLYKIYTYDLTNHFEPDIHIIEKFNPNKVYSIAFFDAEQGFYYIKRFTFEETDKLSSFIGDNPKSRFLEIAADKFPRMEVTFGGRDRYRPKEIIDIESFIGVKGLKARGKRISTYEIKSIIRIEPIVTEKDIEAFEIEKKKPFEFPLNRTDIEPEQTSLF